MQLNINNFDLLIFDIDGVLVDVRSSYRTAIKQTAEYFLHKEIFHDDIQQLKNESGFNNDWDLTIELLKRKGVHPSRKEVVDQFQHIYWGSNGDGLISTEKWIIDNALLKNLSNNFKLAIFTGRPREEAIFVLRNNTDISYFDPIIVMEDVKNGKPHPEGLNYILKKSSVHPAKAIYFGDTFDDVRSAKCAEITPIGVIPPGGNKQMIPQFISEGAYTVISNINEISNFI